MLNLEVYLQSFIVFTLAIFELSFQIWSALLRACRSVIAWRTHMWIPFIMVVAIWIIVWRLRKDSFKILWRFIRWSCMLVLSLSREAILIAWRVRRRYPRLVGWTSAIFPVESRSFVFIVNILLVVSVFWRIIKISWVFTLIYLILILLAVYRRRRW